MDPPELFARGARSRRAGDTAEAEALWRTALSRDPSHRDTAVALAFLLREQGRSAEIPAVLRPVVVASTNAADLASIGSFLGELGATDEALFALERAREQGGDAAMLFLTEGRLLLQAGRFMEAAQRFRQTFVRDPNCGAAYYQWVQTRRWQEGEESEAVVAFLSEREQASRNALTRACLGFARAKVLDDLGRTRLAFAALHEANRLRRRELPPFDHNFYEEWLEVFGEPFAPVTTEEDGLVGQQEPLFILGLPRSGTTILARLLVEAGIAGLVGEMDFLGRIATSLARSGGRAHDLHRALVRLDVRRQREAASEYCRLLRTQYGRRTPALLIDKNPLNFWYFPLLRVLFPRAVVLWCRRDPRDVLLSLYFQNFAHPALDFSYDLGDLIRYMKNAETFARLQLESGGDSRLFPVVYEELVRNPEETLGRICRALGLARDERAPPSIPSRESPRRIETASAWQARQPIHTEAIGRWRRYAPHLLRVEPALRLLGFHESA